MNKTNSESAIKPVISSVIGIAFDCTDADELADFYSELLGVEKTVSNATFSALMLPQGIYLVCQNVENYTPRSGHGKTGLSSKWLI